MKYYVIIENRSADIFQNKLFASEEEAKIGAWDAITYGDLEDANSVRIEELSTIE